MTRHRGHGSLAVSRWIGFCLLLVLFRTVTAINVKLTLTNFLKLFEHYEKQSFLQTNSKTKIPTRTEVMTDIGHTEIAPLPVPQLPDKPKSCFGLPAIACQNTQDMENADNAKAECKKMFCDPLCLRDIWKCDIDGGSGAFGIVGSPAVSKALCRQFIAYGCGVLFKCCNDKDPMLHRWTEEAYYGALGDPVMKIGACSHDPKIPEQADLVCTQCKGAVTVSFKLKDDRCEELKANKPLETKWEDEDLFHTESDRFKVTNLLNPLLLKPLGYAGTHRSLYERCKFLQQAIAGQLAVMVQKANDKICKCLGCCPSEIGMDCYFAEMLDT